MVQTSRSQQRRQRDCSCTICKPFALPALLITNLSLKIGNRLVKDGYTPRTWRTHPLHLCPPEPYDPAHPGTRATLDWIFLISSLNFSFWSHLDGRDDCFGVEWREEAGRATATWCILDTGALSRPWTEILYVRSSTRSDLSHIDFD